MIFLAKKTKDKITIANQTAYKRYLATLPDDCFLEITIKKRNKKRTAQQNSALHLWFGLLADELNDSGFDMRKTIKTDIDISWNAINIKEFLWKPVMKAYLKKENTTKLETKDIDKIFDILNKTIGERTGVFVPFPDKASYYPDE